MYEWQRQIQMIVDEIDACLARHNSEATALRTLSGSLGYSEYHATRKFREISGMSFRDYLFRRKLAFALKEVRDNRRPCWTLPWTTAFPLTKPSPGHSKVPTASPPAHTGSIRCRWCSAPRFTPLTVTF